MKYKILLYLTSFILLLTLFCQDKFYYGFLILIILIVAYVFYYKFLISFDLFNEDSDKNLFWLFVWFPFVLWIHIAYSKPKVYGDGYLVVATYYGKTYTTYKHSCRFVYDYKDNNDVMQQAFIYVSDDKYDMKQYPIRDSSRSIKSIIYVTEKYSDFYKDDYVSAQDIEKYKYPVKIINKEVELGNDSYEYAKYERDIAYKHYGLNIVFKAHKGEYGFASVYFFNQGTKTIGVTEEMKEYPKNDFLVYSNINPDFFDGWHLCPDNICTPEIISDIDSVGYGYIFRGKIYSAAETEKYWNIIEQYKLRQ